MAFPEDLPPTSMELFPKLLIYFGVLYVISTAITTWLVTRRRNFPEPEVIREEVSTSSESPEPSNIQTTLSFNDTKDVLSGLKVQIEGAEASLEKLSSLQQKGEISEEAYSTLSGQLNKQVSLLSEKMNSVLQTSIADDKGEIDEGISDDEMENIEADLEKQLLDLDNDDAFLRTRPKKSLSEAMNQEQIESTPTSSVPPRSSPSVPSTKPPQTSTTPPPPSSRSENSGSKVPPPPKKTTAQQPSTPTASSPSIPPTPAGKKADQPSTPSTSGKKAMPPPPPKKSGDKPKSTAKPPSASAPSPQQKETTPTQPKAQQPMQIDADEDDSVFAKSTSIAALRMDMLRELARLKKLISDEDQ